MNKRLNPTISGGLNKLSEDNRDFPLAGIYKQCDINEVPLRFVVSEPLFWKDQGNTDFCSAFAVTEASEDQEGIEFISEYQFFKTKQLMGDTEWGADLRRACKVLPKFGSLPFKGNERFVGIPRYQVLQEKTWPRELDFQAIEYSKESYFSASTGKYDLFDNLRTHLWQHREDKSTIVTGCAWRSAWTVAPDGIIPKTQYAGEFGHAFKLYGSTVINGEPYLIAQLSNGRNIGDGGRFYFPREVVNREFKSYGAYMFKDISREEAEYRLKSGIMIGSNQSIWQMIINFFKR